MGFYILPGHIQQLEVCCFEEVLWRNVSWLWVEGWAVEDVVTSLEACDIWTLFVDSLLLAKCCLDVVLVWWLTGRGNMTWLCPAENLRRSPLALASITGDEKNPTSHPGAWIIAVLVIGLSGVWPFVKLGMLLFAWLAPTATLKKGQRARLLVFLDEYGKYSCLFQQHISWELVNFLRVVASPTWIQGAFFVSEGIRVSWCAPTKNAWITVFSPMVAFERDTKTPRLSWLLASYSGIMCFRHQMEACWHWSESYLDFLCFVFP